MPETAVKKKRKTKKRDESVQPPPVELPQYLTIQQAADMLQVTTTTVRALNDRDEAFPRFYVVGQRKRVLLSELTEYMELGKQVGNEPV